MPAVLKRLYFCAFITLFTVLTLNSVSTYAAVPTSQAAVKTSVKTNVSKDKLRHFERAQDGQYLINVYINGQGPYRFMIDTGASQSSLFEATRLKLGVDLQTNATGKLRETYINGMAGSKTRPTIKVDNLQFIGRNMLSQELVVLKDWKAAPSLIPITFDGILGMDALNGMILAFEHIVGESKSQGRKTRKQKRTDEIPTVHQEGRIKILSPRQVAKNKYRKWLRLNLLENPYPVKKYGLLYTYSRFGRLNIPTLVDTGASFTLMDWDVIKGTQYYKERKRLHNEWVIQGAVDTFKPRRKILLERFNFGGLILKNHEVLLADMDELPINDYGKYPMLIVGIDAIKGRNFILDLQQNALLVQRRKNK